jgi:hypothetical protein
VTGVQTCALPICYHDEAQDYSRRLGDYIAWFGYGRSDVRVHNYWEERPFVTVNDPDVIWLALERVKAASSDLKSQISNPKFPGLLLLQSYKEDPVTVSVRFPQGKAMMDMFSREVFTADAAGTIAVPIAGVYGTRLLAVAPDRAGLPAARPADNVVFDDFELGLSSALKMHRNENYRIAIVEDDRRPGNHVLRINRIPGVHLLALHSLEKEAQSATNSTLSLSFRLPALPDKPGQFGVLNAFYRKTKGWPQESSYQLFLQTRRTADGQSSWAVEKLRALREGKEQTFADIGANLVGKPLSGIPADTNWHRLTIEMRGTRHTIRVDDTVIFEGTSDANLTGRFGISPGGGGETDVPYVEIDDLRLMRP